jgi:SAM-dependent MidA family methyltransferase
VTLREKIMQEIREHGPIPFSRYMEMCLYDPQQGYYSRSAAQFGKAGDFYTSSDVHAVFGRLLVRQFEEMWRLLGSPEKIEILELGPGRGLFAQDVLDWSEKKFPDFFQAVHYSLVENSPALRERLRKTLDKRFGSGKASLVQTLELPSDGEPNSAVRLRSGQALEAVPFAASSKVASEARKGLREGTTLVVPYEAQFERALAPEAPIIIFANEFFDALPAEILSEKGSLRISEKDGRFVETWSPASARELEFLDRYGVHPENGERIEIPLVAQQYMSSIAQTIQRGFMVVIDYGYTRQEQFAGRHRGTLMTYRQHSSSANPYEAPGEQDITAHVNFTALAAAAEQNGMQVQPLLTQSQFLLGIGEANQFADAFEECRLPQERAKVALQLKHLVTPSGIGETFHVLVGSKGVDLGQVARLSGLSFGKDRQS